MSGSQVHGPSTFGTHTLYKGFPGHIKKDEAPYEQTIGVPTNMSVGLFRCIIYALISHKLLRDFKPTFDNRNSAKPKFTRIYLPQYFNRVRAYILFV
jgi:hypothetical protein